MHLKQLTNALTPDSRENRDGDENPLPPQREGKGEKNPTQSRGRAMIKAVMLR